MLKKTVLLVLWLALAVFLPGCGPSSSSGNTCTLSGKITDLSGLAANGDALHLYIDNNVNTGDGTTASYALTWTGGTGVGSSMNYSIDVKNVAAGAYYLLIYDDSKSPVYGYSNNPTTAAYGNSVTVNVDCGATWDLSMNTT